MFVSSNFRLFALALACVAANMSTPFASESLLRIAQGPAVPPSPDANIEKIQTALVWTGYYEGPIDGSAGAGTQSAVKKFQHDLGKPETGTLDDSQNTTLVQRAQSAIQVTGYRSILDSRSGIRIGIPFALASQKKNANGGTDYVSPDGRIQIGLRTFRTSLELGAIFNQLKEKFSSSSQLEYSTNRSNWFVLAGESITKKYYVRYFANRDLIAGFFAIHDKSIPKETNGPLVSAITSMSLSMQAFAADLKSDSVANLAAADLVELVTLAGGDPSLVRDDQAASAAPASKSAAPTPPVSVAPAKAPGDDTTLQALQKKITEMESNQRKLEQQLAAKRSEKADAPAPRDLSLTYQTVGIFAAAILLLTLLLRRRSTASKTSAGNNEANRSVDAAPQPVVQVIRDAPVASPKLMQQEQPKAISAASNGGAGLGILVAVGGMLAVVFIVAILVEVISSVTGF